MKHFVDICAFIAALLLCATAKSQFCAPYELGRVPTSGDALNIVVSGNIAYVACGEQGVDIFDISSLASPVLLATLDTPGVARAVDVSGNHLFVADRLEGLQVIDVSDPLQPVIVGSYDTPGDAFGVTADGDLAFVADYDSGLQILDISNPAAPALVGSYDTPGTATSSDVDGSICIVTDWDESIIILDVSTPSLPALLWTYSTSDYAYDVAISGRYAYIAYRDSGLFTFDISNPNEPRGKGICVTRGVARSVEVHGEYVYLACDDAGVQVTNSDPNVPYSVGHRLLGIAESHGTAFNVAVVDQGFVVADGPGGIATFVVPDQPVTPAETNISSSVVSIFHQTITHRFVVHGSLLFVIRDGAGCSIYQQDQSGNWIFQSVMNTDSYDIAISDNLVYLATTDGLEIWDVADIQSPSYMGGVGNLGEIQSITLMGNTIYLANKDVGTLYVVDVADPTAPVYMGGTLMPGDGWDIIAHENYVFEAGGSWFSVADVTDPTAISTFWHFSPISNAFGLDYADGRLFVVGEYGFFTLDVTNPTQAVLEDEWLGLYRGKAVQVVGDRAYVADEQFGLLIFDISDSSHIECLGILDETTDTRDVHVADGLVYLSDRFKGVFVIAPSLCVDVCYADCDESGALTIFDYICFGNAYAGNGPYADCDNNGSLNVFDYICYGNAYSAGCP